MPALPPVDWARPWLAPYRAVGERLSRALHRGFDVASALNAELAARPGPSICLPAGPLRFVPQSALPVGIAYEAHIAATARVPTRHNLHDLFNGLVWLHFPRIKQRLNAFQAAELQARGVGATRGAVRDGLTLFDENAGLLQCPPPLAAALVQRDWQALFVTHRALWSTSTLTLFGHALLEKLCQPRPAITAHVWLAPVVDGTGHEQKWAEALAAGDLAAGRHHPLPVLGVPGWWQANEHASFYGDTTVFRAGRGRQPQPSLQPSPMLHPEPNRPR